MAKNSPGEFPHLVDVMQDPINAALVAAIAASRHISRTNIMAVTGEDGTRLSAPQKSRIPTPPREIPPTNARQTPAHGQRRRSFDI